MLRSTMNTEYTSVEMEYTQPANPARPPMLQLHVAHPRVLLLMRFVNDLLYAVEVVQVRLFAGQSKLPDHQRG